MKHYPRKRFGQHFLRDEEIISRIISAIHVQPTDHMVEIGPGLGALTKYLLLQKPQLDLVEIDRDLTKQLRQLFSENSSLKIHEADILQVNLSSFLHQKEKLRIVGNLPYNVTSPIIFYLLSNLSLIEDVHVMVQKEVAERLCADVDSSDYSRLTVMVQYYCQIQFLFDVAANAFDPPPRVESAVIRLIPRRPLPAIAEDIDTFSLVVKTAFNQRRKTIQNSLKGLISSLQLQELGINPEWRPQNVSVSNFVKISNWLYNSNTK